MPSLLSIARCALVAASGLLFAGSAYWGAARFTAAQNLKHLAEINETALRHVETAIDSAERLLAGTAREMPVSCGDAVLQAIRLRVYQHSGIKDVRVTAPDGAVRCSAYSETLEFDRTWPTRSEMIEVAGTSLRLFRAEQFASDALGVFSEVGQEGALAAIVGIDPLQFDVIPGELRPGSQVSLILADDQTIIRHAPAGVEPVGGVLVARASSRYPIRTVISVDHAAFEAWNRVPTLPLAAGSAALGMLFGLLAARLMERPADAAAALDRAIAAREFRPYYQPIFALGSRRILGCEVLMRWALADGRILGPGAFIPLAESTGRIEAMTWQVLERALDELRLTMNADAAFKVSVNVVPRHFLSAGFTTRLREVVSAAGARPAQVVLEITERDEMEDFDRAQAVIQSLRESGFRIAMDDVGVGHSGLSHIQRLRPDTLKIDKVFVDSIGRDGTADAVVAMLVRLGRELHMGVVAEGIETETQAAALQACGVGEGQGYLVAPPLPASAFLARLTEAPSALAAAA